MVDRETSAQEPDTGDQVDQLTTSSDSGAAAYKSVTEYTETNQPEPGAVHVDPGTLDSASQKLTWQSIAEYGTIFAVLDHRSHLVGKPLRPHRNKKGLPIAFAKPLPRT